MNKTLEIYKLMLEKFCAFTLEELSELKPHMYEGDPLYEKIEKIVEATQ